MHNQGTVSWQQVLAMLVCRQSSAHRCALPGIGLRHVLHCCSHKASTAALTGCKRMRGRNSNTCAAAV